MNQQTRRLGIFFPLLLIAIGVFFLLNNFGIVQSTSWNLILWLWPVLLIIGGLDSLYRGEGIVGPIFSAGMGVIFLLSNLGYLGWSTLDIIIRFWPVLLLAWGFDLIVGRRGVWSVVAGTVLGLALVAGVALASQTVFSPQNLRAQTISQPLQQANQADVDISEIFGNLSISASNADTANLLQGNLSLSNSANIKSSYSVQDGKGIYHIWDEGNYSYPVYTPSVQTGWNIMLNPQVPVALSDHLVIGNQQINLTGINLKSLDSGLVIGKSSLTLAAGAALQGKISGVIGETDIFVPRGTPLRLQYSGAITAVNFPSDYQRTGNLITSPPPQESNTAEIDLTIEQTMGVVNVQYLP
ncbi:MAG TPA: DUF5668 domain-containing protein [Anaerolineaceae bacterium]|nr:DUF5668 domain-containing protein [Anaerolineaceae bacterium]